MDNQLERLVIAGIVLDKAEEAAYLSAPEVLKLSKDAAIPSGYKRCGGCKDVKKLYLFNRNNDTHNKCTGNCKACQKASAAKSYEKTKGTRDYKTYYREHKEQKQEQSHKYYLSHIEELREKQAAYRSSAAGKRVMKKAHKKRRRLISKNTGIPYTREMVIERDKQNNERPTCYLCGQVILTDKEIHMDHVIPVVEKGKDCFTNIACVHDKCNLTKSKDAHEITTEQVEGIVALAEAYIDAHPDKFPDLFDPEEEGTKEEAAQ